MVNGKQINGATVLLVHGDMQQVLKTKFLDGEASYRGYSEWIHMKLS